MKEATLWLLNKVFSGVLPWVSCTIPWVSFPSCVLPETKKADEFLVIPSQDIAKNQQ